MQWWIWILIGILLFGAEMIVPLDFFLFFIGLSFIVTGGLVSADLLSAGWMQALTCAILSVVFLVVLKPKLSGRLFNNVKNRKPDLEGDQVLIVSEIQPGKQGKGDLRGSSWQVLNKKSEVLKSGESYEVTRVDGLVLVVE